MRSMARTWVPIARGCMFGSPVPFQVEFLQSEKISLQHPLAGLTVSVPKKAISVGHIPHV